MNFNFEPVNFVKNLPYMAKGMLGILTVIVIIIIITVILNASTKDKNQ